MKINGKTFYEITWTQDDKTAGNNDKVGNAAGGGMALVTDKIQTNIFLLNFISQKLMQKMSIRQHLFILKM